MNQSIEQRIHKAKLNQLCGVCLERRVAKVCRKCESENQLSGFCVGCMFKHNTERCHGSDFRMKMRATTIRRILHAQD